MRRVRARMPACAPNAYNLEVTQHQDAVSILARETAACQGVCYEDANEPNA